MDFINFSVDLKGPLNYFKQSLSNATFLFLFTYRTRSSLQNKFINYPYFLVWIPYLIEAYIL